MKVIPRYHLFFVMTAALGLVQSANILMISTVCSPSHSLWFYKFAKLLLARGHQVTLLDTIDRKEEISNLTQVFLEGGYVYSLMDLEGLSGDMSMISGVRLFMDMSEASCRSLLNSAGARRFMESVERGEQHFQLVIHDGVNCESFLGWVWRLPGRPALVQATAYRQPLSMFLAAGEVVDPSYMVVDVAPFSIPMTFFQRVANVFLDAYIRYVYAGYMDGQNALARQFFGEGLPPLEAISRNSCVFLVNSHFVLDGVRPHLPNVIPVGGLQIGGTGQPIPPAIENFIEGAKHGLIYFSLGSNILSSNMDPAKRDMFLEVFRELPQRILWKWESDDIPSLPRNVMVSKWFPQSQILAHPNTKLYISHGGLMGTQEGIYHGVPMVVIPFIVDQYTTAAKLQAIGVAVTLQYTSLTKSAIKRTIQTVLTQPSFSENVRTLSKRFVDMPDTPQERAVFWIEYALRHPDCSHIRSPAVDMPPYQRMLLDVYLLLGAAILTPVVILITCIRLMCKKAAKMTASDTRKQRASGKVKKN